MKRISFAAIFIITGCAQYAPPTSTTPIRDSTFTSDSIKEAQNKTEHSPIIDSLKVIAINKDIFNKAYSHLSKKGDEFEKSKFLLDKSSPKYVDVNGIFYYIQISDQPFLRLDIQYSAEDWLFIKSMTFNADGVNFDYTPARNFKTDNGSGHIWEWSDEMIDDSDLPMMVALATAKKAKVKYLGTQYYKVVNITHAQQAAMLNILRVYKGLLLGYKK